jgi:hypothetical protein
MNSPQGYVKTWRRMKTTTTLFDHQMGAGVITERAHKLVRSHALDVTAFACHAYSCSQRSTLLFHQLEAPEIIFALVPAVTFIGFLRT